MAIFGEYDEPDSSTFSVVLKSCDTLLNAACTDVKKVSEWLAHKYLIVVYTERRFSHQTGKAIEESKMARIPINNFMNTHYKYAIEVSHLVDLDNLENTIWPAGDRTFEDFYELKKLPDQPLVERAPADEHTILNQNRFQVSFEVSKDQIEVHVLP